MQRLQWAALLNVSQSAPVLFYQSAPVCGDWLSPAHSLRRWRYCVHGFTLALLPATNAEQRTEPAVSLQQWVWLSHPRPWYGPLLCVHAWTARRPSQPLGATHARHTALHCHCKPCQVTRLAMWWRQPPVGSGAPKSRCWLSAGH